MARYVDVDKLMKVIEEAIEPYKSWDCTKYDTAIEAIESMLTADVVEVKHGEWLLKHIGAGHYWECSECAFQLCTMPRTKYCPECGAQMRGVAK